MKQNLLKRINKLLTLSLIGLVFLVPVFFLPVTPDRFEYNKRILLIVATLFTLLLWSLSMVLAGQVRLIRSKLEFPLMFFWVAVLISTFITRNRLVSMVDLETWLLLCIPLLYFIYLNNLRSKIRIHQAVYAFILSGAMIATFSVFNYFSAPVQGIFNLAGSTINSNIVMLITLIISGTLAFTGKQKIQTKILLNTIAAVSLFAIIITNPFTSGFFTNITGVDYPKPILLDHSTSWQIAVESVKTNPLWGSGPGTYSENFMRFKPRNFNNSDYWNLKFGSASNIILHMLSETGFLGFLSLLIVLGVCLYQIYRVIASASRRQTNQDSEVLDDNYGRALLLGLLASVLGFLILPLTAVTLFLFILLAAIFEGYNFLLKGTPEQEVQISVLTLPTFLASRLGINETPDPNVKINLNETLLPRLVFSLVLILSLGGFYLLGRVYAAEVTFKKSLEAATAQKGKETYDLQNQAIKLNPYEAKYHISYANTNLALANAIAEQYKNSLTDPAKQQIVQLIQQAVREARVASAIAPNNSSYWENLALIYKNILGVATGADQWAINAYSQAILLNPTNPRLRVDIGGVFFRLENYEKAAASFTDAINLKRDFANAYYNLAWALRQTGRYKEAVAMLEIAMNLTEQDSQDFEKAQKEMEEFRSLASQQEAQLQQQQVPQLPQDQVLGEVKPIPEVKVEPEEATSTPLPAEPTPEDETSVEEDHELQEPPEQPESTQPAQEE